MREIKEIQLEIKKEIREYELKKNEFYSNPMHWSNNKRKMHGLPVLRGDINKDRIKKFYSFKPSPIVFYLIEDIMEEILPKEINKHFEQFADIKDFSMGRKLP